MIGRLGDLRPREGVDGHHAGVATAQAGELVVSAWDRGVQGLCDVGRSLKDHLLEREQPDQLVVMDLLLFVSVMFSAL